MYEQLKKHERFNTRHEQGRVVGQVRAHWWIPHWQHTAQQVTTLDSLCTKYVVLTHDHDTHWNLGQKEGFLEELWTRGQRQEHKNHFGWHTISQSHRISLLYLIPSQLPVGSASCNNPQRILRGSDGHGAWPHSDYASRLDTPEEWQKLWIMINLREKSP